MDSGSQWRDGILGLTTQQLVDRNGASFLASLLQRAVTEQRELIASHHDEMQRYIKGNRGGLALANLAITARRTGRKTLRVADVLSTYEAEASA